MLELICINFKALLIKVLTPQQCSLKYVFLPDFVFAFYRLSTTNWIEQRLLVSLSGIGWIMIRFVCISLLLIGGVSWIAMRQQPLLLQWISLSILRVTISLCVPWAIETQKHSSKRIQVCSLRWCYFSWYGDDIANTHRVCIYQEMS